jgi:hypothetical protein
LDRGAIAGKPRLSKRHIVDKATVEDGAEKGAGMQIQFTYDQSVGSLPTGMVQALDVAASYLGRLIANPITINIEVGYGEITQAGQTFAVSSGAEGGPVNDVYWTYAQTAQIYGANVSSPDQAVAYSNLPAYGSVTNDYIDVSAAQQKAFGQLAANNSAIDGAVGFQLNGAGGVTYDFNPFRRAVSNEWDFIGVALHEISHALGRISDLGMAGVATLLDLFRYAAPGQLQTNVTGSPAYFSLDGGATNLANFDTTNQDPSDWAQGSANDANNAVGSLSVANNFGQVDLRELNALGFQRLAQTDDFNGDGTSDLIWQNTSTGALTEWQFANGAHTGTVSLGSRPAYQIVGTGDFNGDGTTDLLFMNPSTGDVMDWLMTNGQQGRSAIALPNMSGSQATVGYFRGGGVSAIIWQNTSTGAITEWIMGHGNVKRTVAIASSPGWTVIGSGDFNGDGATDLLMQAPTGNVWDWIMTDGRHTSGNLLGSMTGWTYLGGGDFNGDGTADLLWRNNATNDVQEWLMSNGLIGSQVDLGVVAGSNVVATGDYFATGTSDIVWQNTSSGATTVWAMLNGQHQSAYDVNLGATSGLKAT